MEKFLKYSIFYIWNNSIVFESWNVMMNINARVKYIFEYISES